MRAKTEFAECPPLFKVERVGERTAKITFTENAEEVQTENGSKWVADVYELITTNNANIAERVENNYAAWLQRAKAIDRERAATEVRVMRDKLLAESDKDMVLDRMGLTVPSGSTFTAWLTFLRNLGAALSGAKATYRQALRDLPEQPGFPYDIQWPEE